jgi:hypothetical protein
MSHKASHNYQIENNEVVLERKCCEFIVSVHVYNIIYFLMDLGGLRESEVVKQAISIQSLENSDPEYISQVLVNLMTCIRHGNCELPIKNFK